MIGVGFLVFFYLPYDAHNMTPNTGEDDMYWALILRGIGLGLLFVPSLPYRYLLYLGKNIGEGAAFTGMMRQLGGSFGIAIITTLSRASVRASCSYSFRRNKI
jgi:DHA2 family multidrug resistance protein